MTEHSDHRLIEMAIGGDRAAFARLVERYYDTIFRVAFKWCANREDAEDVAQDVCVKLGRTIRGFKGNAAFSSWLYRVTLNAVRDLARTRERQARHVAAMALVSETDYRPDREAEMTCAQLWQSVHDLPEKQRDAVLLVYSEELNHAQAAEVMGCAESTVSWHIHEAKKQLKGLLVG